MIHHLKGTLPDEHGPLDQVEVEFSPLNTSFNYDSIGTTRDWGAGWP